MYNLDKMSDKFIQRLATDAEKLTIIYTPRGKRLHRPITRQQFDKMFDCIRELHKNGIIHRDISTGHFLSTKSSLDDTEKIFLIDFGSASSNEKEKETNSFGKVFYREYRVRYLGTVLYASNEILNGLMKKM
jgi:serine/threonine protein kinase